jgi:hypothetical protein
MFKILVIVTAGSGYGEGGARHTSTQVIEFTSQQAAIAATNAINKDIGGAACSHAICLW